jgi:hypothetical protein
LRRQLDVNRGELSRLASAAQRVFASEVVSVLFGSTSGDLQRGVDRARSYPIHSDTLRAKLFAKGLDEVHGSGFGLGVIVKIGGGIISLFRGSRDDCGARLKKRYGSADDPKGRQRLPERRQ